MLYFYFGSFTSIFFNFQSVLKGVKFTLNGLLKWFFSVSFFFTNKMNALGTGAIEFYHIPPEILKSALSQNVL